MAEVPEATHQRFGPDDIGYRSSLGQLEGDQCGRQPVHAQLPLQERWKIVVAN